MTASARLELRLDPEAKARIERAAAIADVPMSDFVRSAVEERTSAVLAEYETRTWVPADFFDDLMAALDEPPRPNAALAAGAKRARSVITRH